MATTAGRRTVSLDDFIGRRTLLRALLSTMRRSIDGEPAIVTIEGEPGIGKTRLIAEITARARPLGARVDVARCYAHQVGALAPLADTILPDLAELSDAAHRLADLDTDPAQRLLTDHQAVIPALVNATIELARRRPLTLVIDDLHWCDSATGAFVEHLAFRMAERSTTNAVPLLLLASCRPDSTPRAGSVLEQLARHPISHRVRLDGLTASECGQMIRRSSLAPAAERLGPALADLVGGNPLVLRSALDGLDARFEAGEIDLASITAEVLERLDLPTDVESAIDDRLAAIPAGSHDLLAYLAVAATDLTTGQLAELTGRPLDDVHRDLVAAEEAGLVGSRSGRLSWQHPLYAHRVRRDLGALRRERIHFQLAELLDAARRPGDDSLLPAIANHMIAAGPAVATRRAYDTAIAAAHWSAELRAWREAARLYDAALRLSEDLELAPGDRAHLLFAAGESCAGATDTDAAMAHLMASAAEWQSVGNTAEQVRSLMIALRTAQREMTHRKAFDIDALEALLPEIEGPDPALAAELRANLAAAHHNAMSFDTARSLAIEAAAAGEALKSPGAIAIASAVLGRHHLFAVEPVTAAAHFDRAAASSTGADWIQSIEARQGRGLAHLMAGHLDDARAAADDLLGASEASGWDSTRDLGLAVMASVDLLRGDLAAVDASTDEAREQISSTRRTEEAMFLYPTVLTHLTMAGRRDELDAAIDEWRHIIDNPADELEHGWSVTSAWALAFLGEEARAHAIADELEAFAIGDKFFTITRPALAAFYVAAGQLLRRPTLVDHGEGFVQRALGNGQRITSMGAVALDLVAGISAQTHDRLDEARQRFEAAADLARQQRAWLVLAQADLLLAELLAVGEPSERAPLDEAAQLIGDLGFRGLHPRLARIGAVRHLPPAFSGRTERYIWFVDVSDSTRLTQELGDQEYIRRARELETVLVAAVGRCGGEVLDGISIGDGIVAMFVDGSAAMEAGFLAIEGARSVGLELHIGVHVGPVIIESHRARGGTLNTAARYCEAASAGEIFVSAAVAESLRHLSDLTFESRGQETMKGLAGEQEVFEVRPPASPEHTR